MTVPCVCRKCLQWGRNLFVAECRRLLSTRWAWWLFLQWGRNLFVAECCDLPAAPTLAVLPSMGPQLVRCGMSFRHYWTAGNASCLQWGRNLFVAECPRADDRRIPHPQPSMGPQLVRCGMPYRSAASGEGCPCLQWGRNLFVAECPSLLRSPGTFSRTFNGAATCSLRNVHIQSNSISQLYILQWGRNLFVAECGRRVALQGHQGEPSMGPQLVRCGMLQARGRPPHVGLPSMGPQLVRCGMRLPPTTP